MDKRKPKGKRLIIVSNRLPFTIKKADGSYQFDESVGGLATGLRSYLESMKISSNENLDYAWVGWPGTTVEDDFNEEVKSRSIAEYRSYPVFLSEEDMEKFYHGFCNKTIWPLFHYFPSLTIYQEDYWQHYNKVNEIFCNTLINIVNQDDLVWIHDYHLMQLPLLLQARTPNIPIGFFLHIPFPSFEIFRLLPDRWRRKILEGLLGANLIGFHTYDYMQHFLQCVLRILGYEHNMGQIMLPSRIVKVDTFPMGIDFKKYSTAINDSEIQWEAKNLKETLSNAKIVLSVDRLDYSKGIFNRLQGFEILLEEQSQFRNNIVLILIIVPSRIGVEHYEQMKKQIEELVGKINGRFGTISWTPILYQYKYLPFQPLAALYNISDVALVTPLRDGMNLVAKEYIASKANELGVLILSEMAGSAKELGEAIIINPNNREEIASALREALEMPEDEQTRRMKIMRLRLQRYDIIRWGSEFVHQLIDATELQIRNYVKVLT
ncbi:MAG TPA: bifunctional alpha,alpha-trehalose-phosphate synthase (UDP-forming)/trehalose-phosphatase, partial [Bacteroidota bacterium]|nr:bifunctional alpha,alpha-trehalose-phosphate synthase (UDP-forming)/trehalose-phosphatase [Bacteroidota bacterium]